MPSLEQQISSSRREVERRSGARPLESLERAVLSLPPIRPFTEWVVGQEISFIVRPETSDPELMTEFLEAEIAGLAVGRELLSELAEPPELPVLLIDLIVDRYQLVEARVDGADAVLLMAAAFEDEDDDLEALYRAAADLGLEPIVEVDSEEEIEHALELLDPDAFLVRNRDDHGRVDFERTFSMLEEVPAGKVVLSWGGVRTRDEVRSLERAGVDALILGPWVIGEGLVETARRLRGDSR